MSIAPNIDEKYLKGLDVLRTLMLKRRGFDMTFLDSVIKQANENGRLSDKQKMAVSNVARIAFKDKCRRSRNSDYLGDLNDEEYRDSGYHDFDRDAYEEAIPNSF